MKLYDVILIAVAMAMDASAITISNCTVYKNSLTKKKAMLMPILFAIFQGVMPLIGFFIGSLFSSTIEKFASFLSSGIFFILSAKIVFDILKENKECECSFKEHKENKEKQKHATLTVSVLIVQAVATSIDALVVGITFINLSFSVFLAVLVVAVLTFIIVFFAYLLGKKLGCIFNKYAEWVGAGILLALAIKSLIQTLL